MATNRATLGLSVLLTLGGCGAGALDGYSKGDDAGGLGDTAFAAADPCAEAGAYLQGCGQPATETEYQACLAGLDDVEASCDAASRASVEEALTQLYACLSEAQFCAGDTMTQEAFDCQRAYADATAPYASCQR